MLKTYLYIPEELAMQIRRVALSQKKSKAEVMRNAIKNGLNEMQKRVDASLNVFSRLAEIGKKYNLKGPKDASKNIDKYLWDKYQL